MTAYFAHELRNPLSAIDCALVALQSQELNGGETKDELLQSMTLCCSFMTNIMNNLLDVRKLEEGQMVLQEDEMCLQTLLNDVQKMQRPSMNPGVTLIVHCDTNGQNRVMGDEHRVLQVLTNVTSNAVKYTRTGSITLTARWIDGGDAHSLVQLECQDTGPGIPEEELHSIFNLFSRRGGAPGTGLGLAIAKRMVELMHGTIRFESDPALQPGTRCFVELPLRPVLKETESELTKVTKPSMVEAPLHILLVDDLAMNRTLLQHRFEKCIAPHCTVRHAATGEEAIQLCEKLDFDVIVMDHYMEGAGGVMLGTDTIIALRRAGVTAVIIGCSGNTLDAQFRAAGADGVWKKPLPPNDEIIHQLRSFEEQVRFQSTKCCAI